MTLLGRIFLLTVLMASITACHHYMELDKKNPEKYTEFWDDERNVKSHLLYGWSDNCKENNDTDCR